MRKPLYELENLASAKPFKDMALALVALMPVGKFYTFLYANKNPYDFAVRVLCLEKSDSIKSMLIS